MRREIGDQQAARPAPSPAPLPPPPRRDRRDNAAPDGTARRRTRPRAAVERQAIDIGQPHLGIAGDCRAASRSRAIASISGLTSTPTARLAWGASNSSIRPVPVPASSRFSIGCAVSRLHDRRFDIFFRRMQGADALPFRGIGLEIGGGRGGARLAHMRPAAPCRLRIRPGSARRRQRRRQVRRPCRGRRRGRTPSFLP